MEDKAVLRIIEKLEKIDGRLDGMDKGIAELKVGQARLESDVADLKRGQASIERRLGRVEGKVDAIAEQTAHFMEFETEAAN
jgi:DNA-binding FrmR family transcriptional regulator